MGTASLDRIVRGTPREMAPFLRAWLIGLSQPHASFSAQVRLNTAPGSMIVTKQGSDFVGLTDRAPNAPMSHVVILARCLRRT